MTEPANEQTESVEWVARLEADAVIGADARYRLTNHQNAVGDVAEVIARHMGMSEGLCLALGTAAAYH